MSPTIYYETFKTQHEELIRQANHERLIKQVLAGQPSSWDRAQAALAQTLIKIGTRLQGLAQPKTPAVNQGAKS